jgi:hypothetical protein
MTGRSRPAERDASAKVEAFVSAHFTWPGTLRLHRAALGWDVLRAPVNLLLAPLLVLTRLAAVLCGWLGLRRLAGALRGLRILVPTSVARRVETLILTEVLDVPVTAEAGPEGRVRDLLSAKALRDAFRAAGSAGEARRRATRIASAVSDYAGVRSAVAEMVTALVALALGAIAFRALTPGALSLAPDLAGALAQETAVADFPLGETLGGLWYGAFPVGASTGTVALTALALVLAGAVVSAFAGVLTDPVQARLGIHRRRLLRLLDTVDAELSGDPGRPFATREHYYARVFDLWDGVVSALRLWKP